jgi:RNA polymerase sigma-70 factor (ECF subfamily)
MPLSSPLCESESIVDSADASSREAELIRATVAGDARAFEPIVHLYGRRVFTYLHQMTRQAQDAEDLAQQTFIKAYASLHRFDLSRPLIGWLLTIARRTALNHFRAARQWEPVSDEIPATELSPARQAEDRDRVDDLWSHARRMLTPREFEILWLRFAENLSVADTARVAGLTQTHVKILVFRARRKLMKTPLSP